MSSILFNGRGQVTEKVINTLAKNNPAELIAGSEDYYNTQLFDICQRIVKSEDIRIILISGPSGSGKTTTAQKLSRCLAAGGRNAVCLSLDDFFYNRDALPRLTNGETDFESVNTLDIPEIRRCFVRLLAGEPAVIPYFDFVTGKRIAEKQREIACEEKDLIILEGLHGLNPLLTDGIETQGRGFLKIYVNPMSQIVSESGKPVLRRRSLRLMRRMIRDYQFRGSSPENTLRMWDGVCREEIKTIADYCARADFILDTTHFYEPCIYHHFLPTMIAENPVSTPQYRETLQGLLQKLDDFENLPLERVPEQSMIREFIGEKKTDL